MAAAIFALLTSLGIAATGFVTARAARRMRRFHTTLGTVVARRLAPVRTLGEGRDTYRPHVVYIYTVDGVGYHSERFAAVSRGVREDRALRELAMIPNEVLVYYDPAAPEDAYLERQTPWLGLALLGFGTAVALGTSVSLLG